jgi:AcrR family transcriptional regulator
MSAADPASGTVQRGQLTKETILATALQLADEDGIGAVTIRRIADELGLSPMSLYRHIRTKEEIVEGLGDLAWEILGAEPDPGVEWDEHLRQTFMHIHRALLDHPGLVDILMLKPTRGMHVYAAIERMIGVLTQAGFSSDDALLAVASLESYTLGFTVQQRVRAGRDPGTDHPPLFDLPVDQFPNLSGDPSKFAGWANEERFVAGLDRAIDYLRSDLQTADQGQPPPERRP